MKKIDVWDCAWFEYEERWDGEEESRTYLCNHPNSEHRHHCHVDPHIGGQCKLFKPKKAE